MALVKFLVALIGMIASALGIYSFVTGYNSWGDIAREVRSIGQAEVQIKTTPQEEITRVRLERYSPFFREPPNDSQKQYIWATEPGHALPFTRPKSIVRLECDSNRKCTGSRLMPVPRRMKHVDTMAIDRARREVLLMDRYGHGAIYRFDDSSYFEFSIVLPCQEYSNFRGGEGASGGRFSSHSPNFAENTFSFIAHATDCRGYAEFGSSHSAFPAIVGGSNFDRFAYKLLVRVKFDAAGFVDQGQIKSCQVSQFDGPLPSWFSMVSSVTPATSLGDRLNEQCAEVGEPPKDKLKQSESRDVIAAAMRTYSDDRLHVTPDIPLGILTMASNLTGEKPGNIVAVVDDTASRTADRALIFTATGVYSRRPVASAVYRKYDELRSIQPNDGMVVVWYGTFDATSYRVSKQTVKDLISTAIAAAVPSQPPTPDTASITPSP